MPNFKRYRDELGHEFTSALEEGKPGWTEVDEPAVDADGKPLPAKPAAPQTAAKPAPAVKAVAPTTSKEA